MIDFRKITVFIIFILRGLVFISQMADDISQIVIII